LQTNDVVDLLTVGLIDPLAHLFVEPSIL
jgi:hypothetical protein